MEEQVTLSSHKKGAIGELKACVWLLSQGYQVFKNITPDGVVDLIAINGDELIKVDVKCASRLYAFGPNIRNEIHSKGVRLLGVFDDGTISWQDPFEEGEMIYE